MERGQRETIRKHTAQLLESLGTTQSQVAGSLLANDVHGTPSDPQGCAVAVYLKAVIGADPEVRSVHVSRSDAIIDTARWWRPRIVVRLPDSVRRFVAAFDERRYPELVRAEVPGGRHSLQSTAKVPEQSTAKVPDSAGT